MKFCTKCGNKLKKDEKYCPKCGNPTKEQLEKIEAKRKEIKEEKKERALLYLGSSLIIIASLIFIFANWNEMSHVFRVLFLVVEMIIFLSLSIFSKGFKNRFPYKTLWFIGLLFLPIIIVLIADYGLFGKYLSYKGAGIYVYLSISWLLCAFINMISAKVINSKIFIYMGYIYLYSMIINILNIFGLYNINNDNFLLPILCLFNLVIISIYSFIKESTFTKTLNKFMTVLIFVFAGIILATTEVRDILNVCTGNLISNILITVSCLTTVVSMFMLMKQKNRHQISYLFPFFIVFILINLTYILIDKNYNIYLFMSILIAILSYFIINMYNNKGYRITSYIIMLLIIYGSILIENPGYKLTLIIAIISFIVKLFISRIHTNKSENIINTLLYTTDILLIVSSIFGLIKRYDYEIIYVVCAVICFTIHIILENKSNNKFKINVFEIFTYIFLFNSSTIILFNDSISFSSFILNEICFIYCFIYRLIKKKNKAINIILYVSLLLNLLICTIKFNIPLYYIFLFISGINIIMYIIMLKVENRAVKAYFYTSYILSIIASLHNIVNYNLISICLNVILYSLIYLIGIKNVKINKVLRYIYTLIGFCLIYKLFNYFIDQIVIVNILTLISFIIIIVSMFLLRVDSDRQVLAYVPVILFPYIKLVENVDVFSQIKIELYVLIIIFLLLLFIERVLKISRDKDKTLLEIIFITLILLTSVKNMLIFNFLLSVFFIFYGLIKKRDAFVIYGIVLSVLSVFIHIFDIADSLLTTYILLMLGVILVVYVLRKESKRNKKKYNN